MCVFPNALFSPPFGGLVSHRSYYRKHFSGRSGYEGEISQPVIFSSCRKFSAVVMFIERLELESEKKVDICMEEMRDQERRWRGSAGGLGICSTSPSLLPMFFFLAHLTIW